MYICINTLFHIGDWTEVGLEQKVYQGDSPKAFRRSVCTLAKFWGSKTVLISTIARALRELYASRSDIVGEEPRVAAGMMPALLRDRRAAVRNRFKICILSICVCVYACVLGVS